MPSPLPPEILDLVVDDLRDELTALRACCLASKLWVSRTRRYVFVRIEFQRHRKPHPPIVDEDLSGPFQPSRSLHAQSHHPRSHCYCYCDYGPLDCAFCNIGHLGLGAVLWNATRCSLLSLHALSPALRSLSTVHFSIPPTEILNLTCSFPFLEDLKLVVDFDGRPNGWSLPSTSPELTGILQLAVGSRYRTRPTECYLLDLPGSLHFSKVLLDRPVEDAELMTIRIHPRRRTISLCVSSTTYGSPIPHPYP